MMSVPKSVIRTTKDGFTIVDNCDKVNYTVTELTRAALRDVGKFLTRQMNQKAQAELKGMKNNPRVRGKNSAFQYWNRKNETDLQVGVKGAQWYSYKQELGQDKMPKKSIIQGTVEAHIADIVTIESQYLSALEDEAAALSKIDEEEHMGSEE